MNVLKQKYFVTSTMRLVLIAITVMFCTIFFVATGSSGFFLLLRSISAAEELVKEGVESAMASRFGAGGQVGGLVNGNLGDFSYYVSGQVDPNFVAPSTKGVNGHELMSEYTTMVWNTLIEGGCTMEGAAALMGNMSCEGAMPAYAGKAFNGITVEGQANPTANQAYTDKLDSGELTEDDFQFCVETPGASGSGYRPTGYGLVQWSSPYRGGVYTGDRKRNLYRLAKGEELSIGSPELQARFVIQELNSGSYNTTRDAVFQSDDLSYCVAAAEFNYEAHAGIGSTWRTIDSLQSDQNDSGSGNPYNRYQNAKKIYDIYSVAADDYARTHSVNAVGGNYQSSVLPANFAQIYNVDTSRMSALRWNMMEKAYYWTECADFTNSSVSGGKDSYIRYSWQGGSFTDQYGNTITHGRGSGWQSLDDCVQNHVYGVTDCSDFVQQIHTSQGLAAPPGNTGSYPGIMEKIDKNELLAGDVVKYDGHVTLFVGWVDSSKTRYICFEASGQGRGRGDGDPIGSYDCFGVTFGDQVRLSANRGYGSPEYACRHPDNPVGTGTIMVLNNTGKYLWIGDSRTVGITDAIGATIIEEFEPNHSTYAAQQARIAEKDDITFICQVGQTVNFIDEPKVQEQITKAQQNCNTIIVALGVNDPESDYKSAIEKLAKGGNVIYLTALGVDPTNPGYTYYVTDAQIETLNANMKSSTAYQVLDTWSWFENEGGCPGGDGLHLISAQYVSWYNYVQSNLQF